MQLSFATAATLCLVLGTFAHASAAPLETVTAVDLARYLGRWYEIARYPNWFQRKCDRDVTATYLLQDNRRITVLNACRRADGSWSTAKGSAKIIDRNTNAKLKVTFFWPFSGNYWIIALDPDYQWAVVGEPSRKYLWVLSRTPQMSPDDLEKIKERIRERGYDPARLVVTRHST